MGAQDILLDRDVRDWVLVPLTISIFLMMLIRQYATQVTNMIFAKAHMIGFTIAPRLLNDCVHCICRPSWGVPPSRRWT